MRARSLAESRSTLPRFPRSPFGAGLVVLLAVAGACRDRTPIEPEQEVLGVLEVIPTWEEPILLARAGDTLRLGCSVRIPGEAPRDISLEATVRSPRGVLESAAAGAAGNCRSLVVKQSGLDTLQVSWGELTARAAVAVALPPALVEKDPVLMQMDSIGGPPGNHWAPSARVNSRGQIEVYVSVQRYEGLFIKETLQRYVSDDGQSFRFDGVVLLPEPGSCNLRSTGTENIAIIPRNDAPGWRMFFAAGANECYGWHIYSAVSTDERNWTVEPGLRVDNGWGLAPVHSGNPYWPQGEGIVIDQLPGGEWRMLQGGYERLNPVETRFQITEYRSTNQLDWQYVGPVLTTRDLPPAGSSSTYSPAIREFAPGLFRMLFTADNRGEPGWRSTAWSAVSLDRTRWQVEGQLLASDTTSYFYAALAGERLFTVRRDLANPSDSGRVVVATVRMP
jgi:hypothetical protein